MIIKNRYNSIIYMNNLLDILCKTSVSNNCEYLSMYLSGNIENIENLKKKAAPKDINKAIDPINLLKKSIINKVNELYNKYYKNENLIIELPQNKYYNIIFKNKYINRVKCNLDILEIKIVLLDLELTKEIIKIPVDMTIDEIKNNNKLCVLFNIDKDIIKYDYDRQFVLCSKYPLFNMNMIKESIIYSIITKTFCEELLLLMFYGGYINSIDGLTELKDFLDKKLDENINLYELLYS